MDALPADGKEGQTYLLRKTEEKRGGFTARGYIYIWGRRKSDGPIFVTNDFTAQDLQNEVYNKLHIDPSSLPGYINISDLEDFFNSISVVTEEEFNQISSGVVIVETEEDLPSTDPGKILQDLGEITINSFEFTQDYEDESLESHIYLEKVKDSLIFKTEVDSSNFILIDREISYNESDELIIGEWEKQRPIPIAEFLVDQIITDLSTLQQLDGIANIKCSYSPTEYTYSYTQYIFDKGVYSEVNGSDEESKGYKNVVNILDIEHETMTLDKTTKEIYEMLNDGPVLFKNFKNTDEKEYSGLVTVGSYNEGTAKYSFEIITYKNYIELGYDDETDTWWYSRTE